MPGMSEASGWHPRVNVVALGLLRSKPLLPLRSPSHLREFLTVRPGSPHPTPEGIPEGLPRRQILMPL